ncbi:MAG: MBL fold metallo-hydrolase [Betaproteobacteria bacterium SG8_39]|nr:MAG: MBL fold metallo-hydrolase [Betaproteobacteria bacterium SG8_39]
MRLTFLGAAGEVTGSCYLVDTGHIKFLIDCGMFQGGGRGRAGAAQRNRHFGFDPAEIAFVLLSHAHIDHSGLIPRLVALGFRGAVYATRATVDLLGVMLPDSGYLQEKEVERENRGRFRRGRGRELAPLYTVQQARDSLKRLLPVEYDADVRPHDAVHCRFRDAGHILGSSILEVRVRADGRERRIVFSGDLGQPGHPIVRDPASVERADVLLVESTYGNRNHRDRAATLEEFAVALEETLGRHLGNVVIPAFAVGRTQDILYVMSEFCRTGRVCPSQVYVDSPMALAATRITLEHPELHDRETVRLTTWLQDKHGGTDIHFTEDVEDSKRINTVRSGAVILSASGMCEGGRIKFHLRYNLPRKECAIVFVGFQAAGTLGRRLVDGAKTVRIFGEAIPVRARIHTIGGLSAHADQAALLAWLGRFHAPPGATWVVHGESLAAQALRERIEQDLGWPADRVGVARAGETIEF